MGSVSYSGLSIEIDPTVSAQITALDLVNSTTLAGYLLLAGGTMTGGIVFDATGLQNINKGTFDNSLGGYNGISLTCAVGYELNWQGGHLANWYSGAYQPIYVDSPIVVTAINSNTNVDITFDAYNDSGAGTHYLHTFDAATGKLNLATNGGGLTFPDSTVQTTAAVAGVSSDKALANAIAASMWYTYDGYDWIRATNTGIVNARVLSGDVSTCGISDGTSFVTGFPSLILTTSLVSNADWFVSVNGTLSDFRIMNQLV
jgi:hypothetical protein